MKTLATTVIALLFVYGIAFADGQCEPGQVVLSSPVDGASIGVTGLDFEWEPESCALLYQLQIAADSLFTQLVYDQADHFDPAASDIKIFGPNLVEGTGYWRVRGLSATSEQGEWSAVRFFTPIPPYTLGDITPNPFSETATVSFTMNREAAIRLEIMNTEMQSVGVILDDIRSAGQYTVQLDASALPAGKYFVRLSSGILVETKAVIKVGTVDVAPLAELMGMQLSVSPMPCTGTMSIAFHTAIPGIITIELFSVTGIPVATLFRGWCGTETRTLTMSTDALPGGEALTAGLYLCRISGSGSSLARSLVVMK